MATPNDVPQEKRRLPEEVAAVATRLQVVGAAEQHAHAVFPLIYGFQPEVPAYETVEASDMPVDTDDYEELADAA